MDSDYVLVEHPREHVSAQIDTKLNDQDLCCFCQVAIKDACTGDANHDERWDCIITLEDEKPTGDRQLRKHHDGKIGSLFVSAWKGCKMCAVLSEYVTLRFPSANGDSLFPDDAPYRIVFYRYRYLQLALHVLVPYEYSKTEDVWSKLNFEIYTKSQQHPDWDEAMDKAWPLGKESPVLPRRINSHSGTDEAFNRALYWIWYCFNNHPNCRRPLQSLPKRVLDLEDTSVGRVRLLETSGQKDHFAALSYSWGEGLPLKTTNGNISQHIEGIQIDALPKTLQDAITIAWRLRLRYIWIDALCIIQDDEQDWAQQALEMTNVFHRATLVISATNTRDCDSGIFGQTVTYGEHIGSLSVSGSDPTRSRDIFVDRIRPGLEIENDHLFTRGWTFQEHLVPHTTLYYTSQGLAWDCQTEAWSERAERDLESKPTSVASSNFKILLEVPANFNPSLPPHIPPALWTELYRNWHHWVCHLTHRDLTYVSDKLPAMAGIASFFASKLNVKYVAGLWQENFRKDLLWERGDMALSLIKHKAVAPSWSWASVTGQIWYFHDDDVMLPETKDDLRIREFYLDEVHPGAYGKLRCAWTLVEGWMQKVVVSRSRNTSFDFESYVSEGTQNGFVGCRLDEAVHEVTAEEDTPKHCWALRLGRLQKSYEFEKHPRIVMLLLDQVRDEDDNRFHRVGLAKVAHPKDDELHQYSDDIFVDPTWEKVVLC